MRSPCARRTQRLLLAFSLGLALCASASGPEEGLVGFWTFEEPEGLAIRDGSRNGLHGTIVNPDAVRRVPGRAGQGIELSGTEQFKFGCVVVAGMDALDFSKGLTVEAWIKPTEQYSYRDSPYLVSLGPSRGPGWRFSLAYGTLALISGDGEKYWGAASNPAETGLPETNRWYHVAATYDGSVYRVYLDGVLAGESEPNLSLTTGFVRLSIGSYDSGRAGVFHGVMDEVKLYTRAKSALEILKDARLQ